MGKETNVRSFIFSISFFPNITVENGGTTFVALSFGHHAQHVLLTVGARGASWGICLLLNHGETPFFLPLLSVVTFFLRLDLFLAESKGFSMVGGGVNVPLTLMKHRL